MADSRTGSFVARHTGSEYCHYISINATDTLSTLCHINVSVVL